MRHKYTRIMYSIVATNAKSSGEISLTDVGRHNIERNVSSTIGMN